MPTFEQIKKKKKRSRALKIDPMKELNKLIEDKALKKRQGSWAEYKD